MALTKPFINTISAFDAQNGTTINLNVLGGDAITAYNFIILSEDNSILYTPTEKINVSNDIANATIRTFIIAINASMGIINNNSYKIVPITYNENYPNGLEGQATNFTCYTTPIVKIYYYGTKDGSTGYFLLENGTTIAETNPNIKIEFNPNDLNSIAEPNIANIYVYGVNGNNKSLIYSSEDIYNFSHDIASDLYTNSTELANFSMNINEDGTSYINKLYDNFEVTWTLRTIENFQPTLQGQITGINCSYKILVNSPYLIINNLCSKGTIEINSSLTSFEGTSKETPHYINGEELDLANYDNWAQWQNYFVLLQPYTFRLWGRNFNAGEIADLYYSSDPSKHIYIYYNQEDVYDEITQITTNYTFVSLASGQSKTINGVEYFYPYYIESERILTSSITETTKLFINVQEQDELFDISFKILN